MVMEQNSNFFAIITVFILISAFNNISYSQSEKEIIDNLALKLQQKVLLTADQSNQVKNHLVNYFKESSDANLGSVKDKIEALLDEKQKVKYDIIKKDWWKSVIKEASASNDSK